MCGLFGSIGFTPDPRCIDIVTHRGPDGRGWQVFACGAGPVALGHRRLAIVDVSDAGLQPMADASGRYHLVFNGEIYNYIELREEMQARGEVFVSHTDSEVLLRAYMLWGSDCLRRLRGMFAFLIWDKRDNMLFAARDRYGIKPLYLVADDRRIALASEIKQLVLLPLVTRRMNIARVHDYLANGITDHTAETLFDGVIQLRAGEYAFVDASSPHLHVVIRRWYPVAAGGLSLTEDEASAQFRSLLSDAVRVHLRSDVPVGSCLSGGLDSSSIVCLMSQMLPQGDHVKAVSACFAGESVDEKPFMDAVIDHTSAQPNFVYPQAGDVFDKASDITWHQDEPFGSTSVFAQWHVFRQAKQIGVKVMLDGQGADEQLAGYHSAYPFYLSQLLRQGRLLQVLRTLHERREMHGVTLLEQLKRTLAPLLPGWMAGHLRQQHRALTQHDWLGSDLLRKSGNPYGPIAVATRSLGLGAPTDIRTLCLAMTFASNLQMLLHWEDRSSMAHSIEARVPFLDHPLVEFCLSLGNEHKIVGADTKRVLRRAMSGTLPAVVLERRDKLGFATPEQIWFRGPLRHLVHEGVEATLSRYPDLMNAAGTRKLRDEMLGGTMPLDATLWRIVNLGIWGELFGVT